MASKRPVQPAHAGNGEASSSSPSSSPWRSGVASWLAKKPSKEVKSVLDQAATDFATFWAKYPAQEAERKGDAPDPQETEDAASKWPQPTHASLLRDEPHLLEDIVKYGQMVQTVYDTLQTKDTESQFFGLCWKDVMEEGVKLGEYADKGILVLQPGSEARDYTVVTRIEADSGAYKLVRKGSRNYVGYVAEGPEDESGGIDVAVVFRGTITKSEWFQDAKALQVAWNKGKPVVTLNSDSLRGWPLGLDTSAVLPTWLGLRVLCALSPALASIVTGAAGLPPFAWGTGLISSAFVWLLGPEGGDVRLTSACLLAGLVTSVVKGVWDAGGKYPTRLDWIKDLKLLVASLPDWTRWGVANVLKAFFDVSQDPHVSFGFKEMYAEAQHAFMTDGPASPRYTILAALTRLLNKYEKYNREKPHSKPRRHIKSITVTGHSLGGALASLCAWDLADTLSEAFKSDPKPSPLLAQLSGGVAKLFKSQAAPENLFERTERQRKDLIRAVREATTATGDKPIVAAVTWAAPRVGDQVYTSYFTGCSLVDPSRLPVKNPVRRALQAALYVTRELQLHLGPAFTVVQVGVNGLALAGLWWLYQSVAGTNPVAAAITTVAGVTLASNVAVSLLRDNTDPKPALRPAMLRVVDAPDVVPQLPLALPVSRLAAYAHGGYEMRVNYDLVPYFLPVAGLPEVSRYHNLEMYMHLVDPRRSMALANRTERVLDKSLKVPGSWWSPVPNNSMVSRDGGKTWVKHEGLPEAEAVTRAEAADTVKVPEEQNVLA